MFFELIKQAGKDVVVIPVYFKRRWVTAPLKYVPDEAIVDGRLYKMRFILLDGEVISEERKVRNCEVAYQNIYNSIKQMIDPEMLSNKEIKDICALNDIPESWITNRFQRQRSKNSSSDRSTRKKDRRSFPLSRNEFRNKFLPALKLINKRSAIVAEILWHFNSILSQGDAFITLEELLRVLLKDVAPDDEYPNWIRLTRSNPKSVHIVSFSLPTRLWIRLCRQINSEHIFVFSNRYGGPLNSSDVSKHFRQAGLAAGIITPVSSLSLRPVTALTKPGKTRRLGHLKGEILRDVSIEEWAILCDTVPGLISSRGRKPKLDPRCIFNIILHRFRAKKSIKELPSHIAVDAQLRRWMRNGNGLFVSLQKGW